MAHIQGLHFYKRRKKINPALFREAFGWISGIFIMIFLAAVLDYFWGMSLNVVGPSMEPTLYNGQRILIDRFSYILASPKEGDVVVFLPNGNHNSHYYAKRVVALPGDEVQIREGRVYVNGEASEYVEMPVLEGGIAENPLTLGMDEYFCIGDSPAGSEDSRSPNIGPVKMEDIIGRAWFRLPMDEADMGFVR